MRACPCCLETLTPGLLGLGGRRLAGRCDVCGDSVCQTCLGPKGRMCRSCLWERLTERGETPSFSAPPGQRQRAARAARASCTHPDAKPCMAFCPGCGDELPWKAEHGNPECDACGAPSHRLFNGCWACGESFEEDNAPQPVARGYRLDFDCDSQECAGKLAWLMPYCPWCGEAKHWELPGSEGLECTKCKSGLDRAWAWCVRCGEEAPLPDDCPRCGQDLDEAASAARCEQCRSIVCGDCFEIQGKEQRLLCSACGEETAAPEAPEEDEAPEEEAPEEDEAGEEDAAPDEDEEPEEDEPEEEEPEDEEPEDEEPEDEEPERDEEPEEDEAPPRRPAAPREAPPPSAWEVLGVAPGAPLPEVKRAYLALVAQYHPDKVAALGPKLQALAQEETRRLIEAWEWVRKQAR